MSDDTLSMIARYSMVSKIMDTGAFTDKDREELETYLAAFKTYDQYRSRLWGAAVRLFNGGRDAGFVSTFARTIDVELTKAWEAGAKEVNVDKDEMTAEDFALLEQIINNETEFIKGMANDIQSAKDDGKTMEQFTSQFGSRVDLWANRWNETADRARIHFGSKLKFVWRLGRTEKHCPFCKALNGIVAYGYEWDEAKAIPSNPPNPALTGEMGGEKGCEGWACDCSREVTTARRTPRAFDKITNIVVSRHL